MNPQALHDTARRYLMVRYAELADRYAGLPGQGRAADGFHYTDEARSIYPRYNVVDAILIEIERLDGDDLPDASTLVKALSRAGSEAGSVFTQPDDEVEARAIAQERARFLQQVQQWATMPELPADPVGYRRVMTTAESMYWRERLQERFGVVRLAWHPMISAEIPSDVVILRGDAMWEEPNIDAVRAVLGRLGVRRVVELREHGPEYEVEVGLMTPRYTGAEGVWCDDSLSWIAYASHEATVAFGGTLAQGLASGWPQAQAWRWSPVPDCRTTPTYGSSSAPGR
ncbi:hypothetical protein Cs7R123_44620 [Catellatospora sp. TT07R-123]|uniref:hypothetical protein n=1 Tax=Catellatospora sp. TT07R-123 TaxID=2733863 RepID=UPI001B1730BB|nr:hypothetical protein [Catellatospora sp. TT07R-123]GHJ47120.1 hypothetical protein Cs7R123_44620 [Catellatospora sp. TT07R-123]